MNFNTPSLHITNEEMGHGLIQQGEQGKDKVQGREGLLGAAQLLSFLLHAPKKEVLGLGGFLKLSGKRVNPRAFGFPEKCCSSVSKDLPEPLTKLCRCPLFVIFPLKPDGSCLFPRPKSQNLLLSALWHKVLQDSKIPFSTICHILRFYWSTALLYSQW